MWAGRQISEVKWKWTTQRLHQSRETKGVTHTPCLTSPVPNPDHKLGDTTGTHDILKHYNENNLYLHYNYIAV